MARLAGTDQTRHHHMSPPGTLLKVRLQLVVSLETLYMVNVTATFLFVYYHDGLAMVRPRQVMMVVVIPQRQLQVCRQTCYSQHSTGRVAPHTGRTDSVAPQLSSDQHQASNLWMVAGAEHVQ